MADTKNNLPEGTDKVIGGASGTSSGAGIAGRSDTTNPSGGSSASNANGARTGVTASGSGMRDSSDDLITGGGTSGSSAGSSQTGGTSAGGTSTGGSSTGGTGMGGSTSTSSSGDVGGSSDDSSNRQGVRGMISSAGTKVKDEAGTRARGFVSQGLERGGSTLTNISGIINQTAGQIEEQLGPQYGDYARKASQALERYAGTLSNKDPDELVDDARELVRKSPGIALAGAAILGFGLVRLIKAGLPEEGSNGNGNRSSDRTR